MIIYCVVIIFLSFLFPGGKGCMWFLCMFICLRNEECFVNIFFTERCGVYASSSSQKMKGGGGTLTVTFLFSFLWRPSNFQWDHGNFSAQRGYGITMVSESQSHSVNWLLWLKLIKRFWLLMILTDGFVPQGTIPSFPQRLGKFLFSTTFEVGMESCWFLGFIPLTGCIFFIFTTKWKHHYFV